MELNITELDATIINRWLAHLFAALNVNFWLISIDLTKHRRIALDCEHRSNNACNLVEVYQEVEHKEHVRCEVSQGQHVDLWLDEVASEIDESRETSIRKYSDEANENAVPVCLLSLDVEDDAVFVMEFNGLQIFGSKCLDSSHIGECFLGYLCLLSGCITDLLSYLAE